jgi:molybdopterin molybdotransferase
MDGYAVRALDVAPGRPLKLVGTAQAGQRFSGMMGPGQCVRIFTGAPMPIGADAVAIQEEATVNGGEISFANAIPAGHNVRRKGNDFLEGTQLLPKGTILTAPALALAAAANRPQVTAARQPRLGMLATGDELVRPGSPLGPDQIVSANGFAIAAIAGPHCAEILDLGIAPDEPKAIEAALLSAFDQGIEVVLTTGGASVGDRDHMREVLIDLGVTLDFWKLAMRPGKPLMFGRRGRTLIFGLPGNPISAIVTATIFVLPVLRALNGATDPIGARLYLPLATPLPANGPRRHYRRGRLVTGATGTEVAPLAETDSAHLSSFAQADVLVVQPENDPEREAGHIVEVVPLALP